MKKIIISEEQYKRVFLLEQTEGDPTPLGVGDKEVFENYPEYQKEWVKDKTEFKHQSNLRWLEKKGIDYLDMNICDNGDGWEELCSFLDKSVPSVEFPHEQ